jgi:hypothetical protein
VVKLTVWMLRLAAMSTLFIVWQGVASADTQAPTDGAAPAVQAPTDDASADSKTVPVKESAAPPAAADQNGDQKQLNASQAPASTVTDQDKDSSKPAKAAQKGTTEPQSKTEAKVEQTAPIVPAAEVPASETRPAVKETAATTEQPATKPAPAVVTYHSQVLAIQPTIVSRPALASADLAAAIPSAPAPDKAPDPAKSSGALAGLRLVLAGVVVPSTATTDGLGAATAGWASYELLSVLVLLTLVPMTYGLWLRRAGYITAARSDVPQGATTTHSLFATPHLMGYNEMPPHPGSPFAVVYETQNVLVQFVML